MNRNEIIGKPISKTVGYAMQGFVYSEIGHAINPQSALLIRTGTKYVIKLIKYASKNYVRIDFSNKTIF